MAKVESLIGQRFGRLTVVREFTKERLRADKPKLDGTPSKDLKRYCECVCDCGSTTAPTRHALTSGITVSCGCYHKEVASSQKNRLTHGFAKTKVYDAWLKCRARCYNPKNAKYPQYGGRGIQVCDRWRESFENFYEDMGEPPSPKHSLGRIDNDGNYEPGNCRWETDLEQANNKTTNNFITYNGKTQTIAQWAREYGISPLLLRKRIEAYKFPIELALTAPSGTLRDGKPKNTLITAFGKTQTQAEWARETGLSYTTIIDRLKKGMTPEEALVVTNRSMSGRRRWSQHRAKAEAAQ